MDKKSVGFIDERYVDQAYRLKRCVVPPENYQSDPLIMPGITYGTVIRESKDLFKMR